MAETKTIAPQEGMGVRFWNWLTETQVWKSVFRHDRPDSDRNRVLVMLSNVFLHLHPVRIRKSGVKLRYTWCMGGLSFFLFLNFGEGQGFTAATLKAGLIAFLGISAFFGLCIALGHRSAREVESKLVGYIAQATDAELA